MATVLSGQVTLKECDSGIAEGKAAIAAPADDERLAVRTLFQFPQRGRGRAVQRG
jgi:hypothetical protein